MKSSSIILYLIAMVVIIVGVDILFFRHHLIEHLVANVVIVIVFTVFYLVLFKTL